MTSPPSRRAVTAGLLPALASAAPARADATPEADWLAYAARLRREIVDESFRFDGEVEAGLVTATNALRAKAGAPPLRREPELDAVARAAAADLMVRGFFDHVSPEGFAPSSRVALLARSLIGSAAENIASGYGGPAPTGDNLADYWADSPGHRANMLKPEHDLVGHGVARRGVRFTAVAVFMTLGARLSAPLPRVVEAAALRPALEAASPSIRLFALEPADAKAVHDHGLEPVRGAPPAGFHRLRPFLPNGPGNWLVTFGPVVELR